MRNRRPLVPVLLVATLAAALVALGDACTGSKNGASPCCAATGQVPPTAPSFTSSAALSVGAIEIVDTSNCPTLNGDGSVSFVTPPVDAGTDSVPGSAGSNGRYSVTFNHSMIGKRGYIALTDASNHILGLGVVQAPLANQGSFHVAPIRYVGGPGRSTLELLAYCQLEKRGLMNGLDLADVRAVISEDVAAGGYNPDNDSYSSGDSSSIASVLVQYRVAAGVLASFGGVPPGTQDKAEENVDDCLDGKSHGAPLIQCTGRNDLGAIREAELYRYWTFATATTGTAATEAITAGAESAAQVLKTATTAEPVAYSFLRRLQLARFEAASVEIDRDEAVLPLAPGDLAAIDASLASMELTLSTSSDAATTATALQTGWNDIVTVVQNAVDPAGACTILAAYNNGAGAIPAFNWGATTLPPPTVFAQMFDPAPTASATVRSAVESGLTNCSSKFSLTSPEGQAAIRLDTFAAINSLPAP